MNSFNWNNDIVLCSFYAISLQCCGKVSLLIQIYKVLYKVIVIIWLCWFPSPILWLWISVKVYFELIVLSEPSNMLVLCHFFSGLQGNPLNPEILSVYNENNGTVKLLTYMLDNLHGRSLFSFLVNRVNFL